MSSWGKYLPKKGVSAGLKVCSKLPERQGWEFNFSIFGLARRHHTAEMLLARTKESAVLQKFEPDELITFEDTCPQKVKAVMGEMQNQDKASAMCLQM